MRLSRLDLIRYGGFADHVVALGTGTPDLHLIVGPNEAGKSTMLEAISDLLFGIHGQTRQAWRYDYAELRIGGVLEHGGRTLEVVRRKGNRNTLLAPDGKPLDDDLLAPILAGIDRDAFRRMYGLDHDGLRSGGLAILEGRDDAAQLVLEAGTGLTGIGAERERLDGAAAELFKPGGSRPIINQLLRERHNALHAVREHQIGETGWTALQERERDARERRDRFDAEWITLASRLNALDRIGRTRSAVTRLETARAAVAELGDAPSLPPDAPQSFEAARAERMKATELADELEREGDRERTTLEEIGDDPAILRLAAEIDALEERRPVVQKSQRTVAGRATTIQEISARITELRVAAGLREDAAPPAEAWKRRARRHVAALAALAERRRAIASRRRTRDQDAEAFVRMTDAAPDTSPLDPLRAALGELPDDILDRIAEAEAAVERTAERLRERIEALAPWSGDVSTLATALPPPEALIARHRAEIDEAAQARAEIRADITTLDDRRERAQARLRAIASAGDVVTGAAVSTARSARDDTLEEIANRVRRARAPDDGEVVERLRGAVRRADHLVDVRLADAARLAEHDSVQAELAEVAKLLEKAGARLRESDRALTQAENAWKGLLSALGFSHPLPPADMPRWAADRVRALTEANQLREQTAALTRLRERWDRGRARLEAMIGGAGRQEAAETILAQARRQLSALEAAETGRRELAAERIRLAREEREIAAESAEVDAVARELDATETQLAEEAGIASPRQHAVADLLDSAEELSTADMKRARLISEQASDAAEIKAFERDLSMILERLGRRLDSDVTTQSRALARELADARALATRRHRHRQALEQTESRLEAARRRLDRASATILDLCERAGAVDEGDLEEAIARSAEHARLRAESDSALDEIAQEGEGLSLDQLKIEARENPPDAAAAERAQLQARQAQIAATREDIGRTLADVERTMAEAGQAGRAAEEQQRAIDASSALAHQAERYVEAATAAAVLRWLVDRHRSSSQAPLIAAAGTMLARVTVNSVTGLTLDYDANDRPQIVATRPDGSKIGAESLSEGTRDQLYLALRLASLAGRGLDRSLPLICDDLLITADDGRASQILTILADASSWTQVLVFTHHEHLIPIIDAAVGPENYMLHRL